MAEGGFNFSVGVQVVADMTDFERQVREGVERSTKTATVPVRSAITPTEQAAVSSAMSQATSLPQTPRGEGAAMAMQQASLAAGAHITAVGSDLFAASRRELAELQSSVATWQTSHQERVKRFGIEDPRIVARVERNWELAQFAQHKAHERAERSAQTRAERISQRAQRNFDAADFAQFKAEQRSRATNADGLDPATDALEAAAWDASWKADKATARDDVARRRGLRGGGPGGGSGPGMAWGIPRSGDTPLGAWRYGRAVAGALAVTEISSSLQAYRGAESASMFAGSPEEAALIRAQGREQGTSGLVLGALNFVPNLLNLAGSPQGQLRQAQEAAGWRQLRDETRGMEFKTRADLAYRRAFVSGGPIAGALSKLDAERAERSAQISTQLEDIQASLDIPVGDPGALTSTKGERERVWRKKDALLAARRDVDVQYKFDKTQLERQQRLMGQSIARESGRYKLMLAGGSARTLERQELVDEWAGRIDASQDPAEIASLSSARDDALAADEAMYSRRQRLEGMMLRSTQIEDVRRLSQASSGRKRITEKLLSRDSLGASLAALEAQQVEAFEGVSLLTPNLRERAEGAIRGDFDAQRELIQQRRTDDLRLIEMNQDSRLRIGSFRAGGLDKAAAIQAIGDSARQASEEFRQRGVGFEDAANKELELGRVGLQGFKRDFMKSFRASETEGISRTYLGGDAGQENPVEVLRRIDEGIQNLTTEIRGLGRAR